MITLTAKIDLISSDNVTIGGGTDNLMSNISDAIPFDRREIVEKTFFIGGSKLADGSKFSDGVNYFVGGVVANESGIFETPYTITVESVSEISTFTIAFDDQNNRHPHSIIIDGVIYEDDDPVFTVLVDSATSHTVYIDNWNTPNYPLVISGIYVGITIDVNYKTLKRIESPIIQRSDIELPSWGIISNGGSIDFNDVSGEIKDYAELQLLKDGTEVKIYLNNTLNNQSEIVGTFYTENWDYDNNSRSVSVSFKDGLEELQNIKVSFDNVQIIPNSLMDILSDLGSYIPKKIKGYRFDDDARERISKTSAKYPIMEKDMSIWYHIQNICEICGVYSYIDPLGYLRFSCEF